MRQVYRWSKVSSTLNSSNRQYLCLERNPWDLICTKPNWRPYALQSGVYMRICAFILVLLSPVMHISWNFVYISMDLCTCICLSNHRPRNDAPVHLPAKLAGLGRLSHRFCSTDAYTAFNEASDRLLASLLAAHGIPDALDQPTPLGSTHTVHV